MSLLSNTLKTVTLICFFLAFSSAAFAQNKVVVIPLFGDDAEPLSNIVTVAKENGQFNNPVAAMASITDASQNNPYLLVIGPGIYNLTETLVVKDFVRVAGSGTDTTVLRGSISSGLLSEAAALVAGASNSFEQLNIQDISLENVHTGSPSTYSIGVFGVVSSLNNIEVKMSGGAQQIGVYGDLVIMQDSSIEVNSGALNSQQTGLNILQLGRVTNSFVNVFASGNTPSPIGIDNDATAVSNMRLVDSGISASNVNNSGTSVRTSTSSGINESYIINSTLTGDVIGNPVCSFTFEVDYLNETSDQLDSTCM